MSKKATVKKTKVKPNPKTHTNLVSLRNNIQEYTISELELDTITPLGDDFGDNLRHTHPDTKEKIKSYIKRDKNGYREVTLDITSYLGSIGAVHYYATLRENSINFTDVDDNSGTRSTGGYGTKGVPAKYDEFKVEVCRPVTQKDIDHDKHYGREGYLMSELGDLTRGFFTEEEAIETGVAVFKILFKGKWKLTIHPYSDHKDTFVYLS